MSRNKSTARAEAGVLPWDQLTTDQQEAAKAIAKMLHEMVTSFRREKRSDDWSFLPVIDSTRRNHVFLIDGQRGSGKSSVLLTLLHAWNRRALDKTDSEDESLCPWPGPAVIPVGLLDLQPMDESTNLVLHLIGTLQRVVSFLESQDTQRLVSPGSWELAAEIPSRQAWRKFAKAAVAAWQKTTSSPKSMDLEEQVAEMEYRERERLDLRHAFVELVDRLHQDMLGWLRRGGHQAPEGMLFVLGIDDADMNPDKSVELLDLLRTLWHPHLVYVLTGDTSLFRKLIERKLKDSGAEDIVRPPQILDKIIPRHQRFRLDKVPLDARPDALVRALRANGLPDDYAAELCQHVRASAWLSPIIPGYLRRIADLAQVLTKEPELRGQVRVLFKDVVDELRNTEPTLSERCTVHEEGGRIVIALGVDSTTWAFLAKRWQRINMPAWSPMFAAHLAADITASVRIPDDGKKGRLLDKRYVSASLLGWRLALKSPETYSMEGTPTKIDQTPVVMLHPRAELWPDAGPQLLLWVFPRFSDSWHSARAYARWKHLLQQPRLDGGMDWLAACYLASVLAGAGIDVTELGFESETLWSRLADLIASLAAGAEAIAAWARTEAPLLAAPESALSPVVANQWLAALSAALDARKIPWRGQCARRRKARLMPKSTDPDEMEAQQAHIQEFLDTLDSGYLAYDFRTILAREIAPLFMMALEYVPVAFAGKLVEGEADSWFASKTPRRWHCLADLIEIDRERFKKLATLDWRKQHELTDQVDLTSPYPRGGAQSFVHQIWRAANEPARRRVGKLITLEDEKLKIRAKPASVTSEAVVLDTKLVEGSRLRLMKVTLPVYEDLDAVRRERAYPVMDAVLRLAVDVAADEADAEGIAPDTSDGLDLKQRVALHGTQTWWPFELETRYGILHLPVPQWPALIDWEILIRSWNRTLRNIQKRQSRGFSFAPFHRNGFLAWYAKLIIAIHLARRSIAWKDVTKAAWDDSGLIEQLVSRVSHFNYIRIDHTETLYRARDSAYYDWLQLIPAILAPEFGLSIDAIEWPLRRYGETTYTRQPRGDNRDLPGRELLRQARHRLWLLSGKPEADIEQALRSIDKEHPEHPWVRLMRQEG